MGRECLPGVEPMSALEPHVSESESETYLKARLVLWIQLLLQVLPVRYFLLGVNTLLAVFRSYGIGETYPKVHLAQPFL